MKKDIKWLNDKILALKETYITARNNFELNSCGRSFYNGMLSSIGLILGFISELNETEVLSKELPVIPQWVADSIESKKRAGKRLNVAMSEFPESKLEKELCIDKYECNELYARAWLDGYTVAEEPLYFALIKGNELITDKGDWTFKYWKLDASNGHVFPSHQFTQQGNFLIKMSKEDWNNLGINDSNADFVEVV